MYKSEQLLRIVNFSEWLAIIRTFILGRVKNFSARQIMRPLYCVILKFAHHSICSAVFVVLFLPLSGINKAVDNEKIAHSRLFSSEGKIVINFKLVLLFFIAKFSRLASNPSFYRCFFQIYAHERFQSI